MPNPARALREIAEIASSDRVKKLALEMAHDLERQHRKQNDDFTAAILDASLTTDESIRALRDDIAALAATVEANMRLSTTHRGDLQEAIEALRNEVRVLQVRPPCMHPDRAQREEDSDDRP